jgi:hypothetical protein
VERRALNFVVFQQRHSPAALITGRTVIARWTVVAGWAVVAGRAAVALTSVVFSGAPIVAVAVVAPPVIIAVADAAAKLVVAVARGGDAVIVVAGSRRCAGERRKRERGREGERERVRDSTRRGPQGGSGHTVRHGKPCSYHGHSLGRSLAYHKLKISQKISSRKRGSQRREVQKK